MIFTEYYFTFAGILLLVSLAIFTGFTVPELNTTNSSGNVTGASFNPVRISGDRPTFFQNRPQLNILQNNNSPFQVIEIGNAPVNPNNEIEKSVSTLGYSFYLGWVSLALQIFTIILYVHIFLKLPRVPKTNTMSMT